jgi:tripartite-type tricarboxylate transporter receptor subunit TctC
MSIIRLLAGVLALAWASMAGAQSFPERPITMIVSFPAGGGADVMARLVAPKMGEFLRQQIVVENRAGAGGQLAAGMVARAQPDGYTILLDASSFVINQGLYPRLPYEPEKAFAPIGVIASFPHVLVVSPGFGAQSVADLIRLAKERPGALNYASSGIGSAQHLAAASFLQRAGIAMNHVPYRGGAPAMTDVMAGHVPMFFANIASGLGNITGGALRPLAVADVKRSAALPSVATLEELGVRGGAVYEWNGVFAPAGTPPAIVARLEAALEAALQAPDVRARIASLGGEVLGGGAAAATRFIANQRGITLTLIRDGNIKPE